MAEWQDFWLDRFVELARNSSPEVAAVGSILTDYERGWSIQTGDEETSLFLASARNIVLELAKRVQQLERG